jgi:hypothetical protein
MIPHLFNEKDTQSVGFTFGKGATDSGLFRGTQLALNAPQLALSEVNDFQKQNGNLKRTTGWDTADQLFGTYQVDLANSAARTRKSAPPADGIVNWQLTNQNAIVPPDQNRSQFDTRNQTLLDGVKTMPETKYSGLGATFDAAIGKFNAYEDRLWEENRKPAWEQFADTAKDVGHGVPAIVDGLHHGIETIEDTAIQTGKWLMDHPSVVGALVGVVAAEAIAEIATCGVALPLEIALGAAGGGFGAHELFGKKSGP